MDKKILLCVTVLALTILLGGCIEKTQNNTQQIFDCKNDLDCFQNKIIFCELAKVSFDSNSSIKVIGTINGVPLYIFANTGLTQEFIPSKSEGETGKCLANFTSATIKTGFGNIVIGPDKNINCYFPSNIPNTNEKRITNVLVPECYELR